MDDVRFLHVPRTGGVSILVGWGLEYPEYKKHQAPDGQARFTYGFARNPWDRVVSIYHRTRDCPDMPFRDWALMRRDRERTEAERNKPIDWMRPCAFWLAGATFVGRFERRREHLEMLARALGRDVPEDHHGATDRMPYTEYYDDETRAWVAEEYAADVLLYGYGYGD